MFFFRTGPETLFEFLGLFYSRAGTSMLHLKEETGGFAQRNSLLQSGFNCIHDNPDG
jgi:hypothetical protein